MNTFGSTTSVTQGRWIVASLLACSAYVLAYTQNYTPFYYFPMVGEFHWQMQDPEMGPGITYYGWKCVGLCAGLLGLLLPARWARRIPTDTVWIGALLLSAVVCVHEAHWFLR